MHYSAITAVVFSIGIAQGLFLLFMFSRFKRKSPHALVLSAWISSIIINLILQFSVTAGVLSEQSLPAVITAFFPFLYSPFLFIACRTASDITCTPEKTTMFHAIPFFLSILARYLIVYSFHSENPVQSILLRMLNIPLFTTAVIYHVRCIRIALHYKATSKEYLSTKTQSYASWIMTLVILSCIIWITTLAMICTHQYSRIVLSLMYTIVVYTISTKVAAQPGLFIKEQELQQTLAKVPAVRSSSEQTIAKLRDYMEKSSQFRNSSLTIADVSIATGISAYAVSKTLNNELGLSFYQFINEYRVREAQKHLANPQNKTLSILDICFTSGFNSKSAFNDVFKRSTGMTPSEFKKKNNSSQKS